MSTYTQICYHIVFSTKARGPVLKADRREDLFRKGQEEHHHRTTFAEDYRKLVVEAGIEFDERYLL